MREKQRRHHQTQRLTQVQLVKLAKAHNLPIYALELGNNMGEHKSSNMAVFGRLSNIQNETKDYFQEIADISKGLDLCNKDDALWDDPANRAKWTAQEITRNKKKIKEEREKLEVKLRGRREEREKTKERRASLSRVEKLSELAIQTRGRQRLRMVARRRNSLNLKEARVRKDIEKIDIKNSKRIGVGRKDVVKSLDAASLLAFPIDETHPFSLVSLLDERILHSRKGNKDFESWISLRTLGCMDIDTYEIRRAERWGRSKSICAPERYRAARMSYVTRMEGFEAVWDLAKEKNLPPVHSTSWNDEPLSKKSTRPIYPNPGAELWTRDRWEDESAHIEVRSGESDELTRARALGNNNTFPTSQHLLLRDSLRSLQLIAGKNDVKLVNIELTKEMEELRLQMYPPEEEWDEDEEGEWDEDEEGDWDEEGEWDEDEDWDEEDWDEEDEEYEEGDDEGGGGAVAGSEEQQGGAPKASGLPEGWVETADEAGNVYYYNESTEASSWEWPGGGRGGAAGGHQQGYQQQGSQAPQVQGQGQEWQTLQDESGNWYYFNPMTGESKWA